MTSQPLLDSDAVAARKRPLLKLQAHNVNVNKENGEGETRENEGTSDGGLDKTSRRKLKKLRKKVRKGQLSVQDTEECKKYGLVVRAEVDWGEEIKTGQRLCLGAGDVRQGLLHILTAGSTRCPSWLRLVNARLLTSVVVVSLANVDPSYMQDNLSQLPFLQACSRPVPVRLYHGPSPRRSIFPLLYYTRKKQQGNQTQKGPQKHGDVDESEEDEKKERGASELSDTAQGDNSEEEVEEKEVNDENSWGKEGTNNVLGDGGVMSSADSVERYVLSLPQLRLAGYPLPPGGVVRKSTGFSGRERCESLDMEDNDGEDDDDVGCPLSEKGGNAESAERKASWLECEETGRWGETGDLLPSLDGARRILDRLSGIKVGGSAYCFYETLESESGCLGVTEGGWRPYRMAALDCEMCLTTEGMEVTRLTLVDEKGEVLLDSFVKPYHDIRDHLTKYSGITPEIIAGCETRLEQVQVALLRLVRADTILVGHSLEQDLMVTGLIHLRCVDTAMLYAHPQGPRLRFALRVLAKRYLQRVIQDSAQGHCSREDAVAALDLVKLKVERGPDFGVEEGFSGGEETRGRESFLERLGGKHGKRCTLLDQSDTLVRIVRGSTASAVVCRSNEEVLSKAKAQARQVLPPHFLWASFAGARPLTLETLATKRKRKLYQMQQERIEADASQALATARFAEAGGGTEREAMKLRQRGEVTSVLSRTSSNNSFSSASNASTSTTTSEAACTRITTAILRDTSGSPTGLTLTATASTAAATRQHKRFVYRESIMEIVDPDLLRTDQQLAELYEALAPNTLVFVVAQPDVALPTQLSSQRAAVVGSRKATLSWTQEHEATLQELSKAAQKGVLMMRVR